MNVRDFAQQTNSLETIQRAMSFHPNSRITESWGIPVEYSGELQTSAGKFYTRPIFIRLHLGLQLDPKALRETFLHELAHAHQWLVHGTCDHGETWWEAMHRLGQKPVRTHRIASVGKPRTLPTRNAEDMGL